MPKFDPKKTGFTDEPGRDPAANPKGQGYTDRPDRGEYARRSGPSRAQLPFINFDVRLGGYAVLRDEFGAVVRNPDGTPVIEGFPLLLDYVGDADTRSVGWVIERDITPGEPTREGVRSAVLALGINAAYVNGRTGTGIDLTHTDDFAKEGERITVWIVAFSGDDATGDASHVFRKEIRVHEGALVWSESFQIDKRYDMSASGGAVDEIHPTGRVLIHVTDPDEELSEVGFRHSAGVAPPPVQPPTEFGDDPPADDDPVPYDGWFRANKIEAPAEHPENTSYFAVLPSSEQIPVEDQPNIPVGHVGTEGQLLEFASNQTAYWADVKLSVTGQNYIEYELRYAGGKRPPERRVAFFDPDHVPEVRAFVEPVPGPACVISWQGDEDTEGLAWGFASGAPGSDLDALKQAAIDAIATAPADGRYFNSQSGAVTADLSPVVASGDTLLAVALAPLYEAYVGTPGTDPLGPTGDLDVRVVSIAKLDPSVRFSVRRFQLGSDGHLVLSLTDPHDLVPASGLGKAVFYRTASGTNLPDAAVPSSNAAPWTAMPFDDGTETYAATVALKNKRPSFVEVICEPTDGPAVRRAYSFDADIESRIDRALLTIERDRSVVLDWEADEDAKHVRIERSINGAAYTTIVASAATSGSSLVVLTGLALEGELKIRLTPVHTAFDGTDADGTPWEGRATLSARVNPALRLSTAEVLRADVPVSHPDLALYPSAERFGRVEVRIEDPMGLASDMPSGDAGELALYHRRTVKGNFPTTAAPGEVGSDWEAMSFASGVYVAYVPIRNKRSSLLDLRLELEDGSLEPVTERVVFDADRIAELAHASLNVDDVGDVTLRWRVDADGNGVAVATSLTPFDEVNVPAYGADIEQQEGEAMIHAGLPDGYTLFVAVKPLNRFDDVKAAPGEAGVVSFFEVTRSTRFAPVVSEYPYQSGSTGHLLIRVYDTHLRTEALQFKVGAGLWTVATPATGAFGTDARVTGIVSYPFPTEGDPETLYWRVRYDTDKYVTGDHTFDRDDIPEVTASLRMNGNNLVLKVDGDEDTNGFRWVAADGAPADPATGTLVGSRTGEVTIGTLGLGLDKHVSVVGYRTATGEGPGPVIDLYYERVPAAYTLLVKYGTNEAAALPPNNTTADTADWHATFVSGDLFMVQSPDGGQTWTGPVRVVGEQGVGGDYTSIMFAAGIGAPSVSQNTADPNPDPNNPTWTDAPPAPAAGEALWMIKADFQADGTLVGAWSTAVRITGDQGPSGQDTSVEYSASQDMNGTWASVFDAATHIYMRVSTNGGATWEGPIRIVGEQGLQGINVSYWFARAASAPTIESNGATSPNPTGTSEWTDAPPAASGDPDLPANTLWMTSAKVDSGTLVSGETWSAAVKLTGPQGPQGTGGLAGDSLVVKYGQTGNFTDAPSPSGTDDTADWHAAFVEGDIFMIHTLDDGQSWHGPIRIVGEQGLVGTDGGYNEYQFARSNNPDTAPPITLNTADPDSANGATDHWKDAPPTDTALGVYLWMTYALFDGNASFVGPWKTPVNITGPKGLDVKVEYSADGSSGWSETFTDGTHLFMRQSVDGGTTWSSAIRIVGEQGTAGADGTYMDYRFNKNQSSATSPIFAADQDNPGAAWTDTPPALSTGDFLWMISSRWRAEKSGTDTRLTSWAATRLSGDKGDPGDTGPTTGNIHTRVDLNVTIPADEFVYLTQEWTDPDPPNTVYGPGLYESDGAGGFSLADDIIAADQIAAVKLSAVSTYTGTLQITEYVYGGGWNGTVDGSGNITAWAADHASPGNGFALTQAGHFEFNVGSDYLRAKGSGIEFSGVLKTGIPTNIYTEISAGGISQTGEDNVSADRTSSLLAGYANWNRSGYSFEVLPLNDFHVRYTPQGSGALTMGATLDSQGTEFANFDVNGYLSIQDVENDPVATANRMYSKAGSLYWNGAQITSGGVLAGVNTLNSLQGDVVLAAGTGIGLASSGQTLTLSNSGLTEWAVSGGGGPYAGTLTFGVDSNLTLNEGTGGDVLTIGMAASPSLAGLTVTAGKAKLHEGVYVFDTRDDVEAPAAFAQQVKWEFKRNSTVDNPFGSTAYVGVQTFAPWSDASGGPHYQMAYSDTSGVPILSVRSGSVGGAWQGWHQLVTADSSPSFAGLTLDTSTASATMLEVTRTDVTKGLRLNAYDGTSQGFVLQRTVDLSAWSDMLYFHPNDGKVSLLGDLSVAGAALFNSNANVEGGIVAAYGGFTQVLMGGTSGAIGSAETAVPYGVMINSGVGAVASSGWGRGFSLGARGRRQVSFGALGTNSADVLDPQTIVYAFIAIDAELTGSGYEQTKFRLYPTGNVMMGQSSDTGNRLDVVGTIKGTGLISTGNIEATSGTVTASEVVATLKMTADHYHIHDRRADGDTAPNVFQDKSLTLSFTDDVAGSPNTWDSVITVRGWAGDYKTWQLISSASLYSGETDLYFRSGSATWGTLRKVLTDGNVSSHAVASFNGRLGAVSLLASDVTAAVQDLQTSASPTFVNVTATGDVQASGTVSTDYLTVVTNATIDVGLTVGDGLTVTNRFRATAAGVQAYSSPDWFDVMHAGNLSNNAVTALNGFTGIVSVAAGSGITVTNSAGTITIDRAVSTNNWYLGANGGTTEPIGDGASVQFYGNTGVTLTRINSAIHVAIGQEVATTSSPTFAALTLSGDLSVAGAVTVGGDIAIQADAANNSLYLGRVVGAQANIDGAYYNYSLGYNTLSSLTTGDYNTALNREALASLTTGLGNFAGGYRAGYNATTASYGVYIGYSAGMAITTGFGNIAIGGYALDVLTVDAYNTAGGYGSLSELTTGAYNTAWGARSGRGVTSTTYSAYFGAYAGDYATGNYVTALGANTGKAAGHYTTYVGYLAGANSTGIHNTSVGYATNDAADATGSYNTNVGSYSLSTATTAHTNTAFGYYSLFSLTTGNYNVTYGSYTGIYLTTGVGNVLMGHDTGTTLTTGSYNVLIGYNVEPSSATAANEINIADVYKGVVGTGAEIAGTLGVSGITTLDGQLTSKGSLSLTNAAATRILAYAQESWNSEEVHRWRISGTGADVVYTYFDSAEVFRIGTDYTTVSGNPNATSFIAGGTRGARVNVETATGGWSRGYVVSSNGGGRAMFGAYGTGSALNYAFIDAGGDSYLTSHFRVYTDKITTGGSAEIGGTLGVGTSAPGSKLEVSEVKDGDTRIAVRNTSTGTLARAALAAYNNTGAGAYLFATGGNYNVYSSWTGAALLSADSLLTGGIVAYSPNGFRVQNSPNSTKFSVVGGNTTVGGTLDVTGAATLHDSLLVNRTVGVGASGDSSAKVVVTGGVTLDAGFKLALDDGYWIHGSIWYDATTVNRFTYQGYYGHKWLTTNSVERMVLTQGGNLLIGSATDSGEALQVKRDTDASAEIGRAHVGFIGYSDYAGFSHIDQNAQASYALMQHSAGYTYLNGVSFVDFRISNSNVMRMDATGLRVGSGTAPTKTLDVTGTLGVSGASTFSDEVYVEKAGFTRTWIKNTTSGAWLDLAVYDDGLARVSQRANADLLFRTNNTDRGGISAAGNWMLGGVADNGYKLDVTGTMRVSGAATFSGDVSIAGTLSFTSDLELSGATYQAFEVSGNNYLRLYPRAQHDVVGTASTSYLVAHNGSTSANVARLKSSEFRVYPAAVFEDNLTTQGVRVSKDDALDDGMAWMFYKADTHTLRIYPATDAGAAKDEAFKVQLYHSGTYREVMHAGNLWSNAVTSLNGATDALTLASTTLTITQSAPEIFIEAPQAIATTSSPTFAALTTTGNVSVGGTLGATGAATFSNYLTVSSTSGVINFTGTVSAATSGLQYYDSGSSLRWALRMGSNTVNLSNRAASGVVNIFANTSTAGAGGETRVVQFRHNVADFDQSITAPDLTVTDRFRATATGVQAYSAPDWFDVIHAGNLSNNAVTALNGLDGAVNIVAGTGIGVSPSGTSVTVTNNGVTSWKIEGGSPLAGQLEVRGGTGITVSDNTATYLSIAVSSSVVGLLGTAQTYTAAKTFSDHVTFNNPLIIPNANHAGDASPGTGLAKVWVDGANLYWKLNNGSIYYAAGTIV